MQTEESGTETTPAVDALVQVSFVVLGVLTRVSAEHDLSVTQLRLLGILRDRTPSMAAIAAFLGLDRSSITGLVDRAERRGIVARTPSPDDARVITVALTDSGRELGRLLTTAVGRDMEQLLQGSSPTDRARLVRLAESFGTPVV